MKAKSKKKIVNASFKKLANKVAKLSKAKKLAKEVDKAVKSFRPRKSERLSFVWISKNGKRARADRKGVLVYVQKNGKKVAVDKLLKREPRLRNKGDYRIERTKKKKAIDKVLAIEGEKITPKEVYKVRNPEDWIAGWKQIRGNVERLRDRLGVQRGTWRLSFSVGLADGRTFEGSVQFDPVNGVNASLRNRIYGFIAELLDDQGLVSRGSYEVVRRENVGKFKADWKHRGRKWYKRANKIVDFKTLAYKIERIVKV